VTSTSAASRRGRVQRGAGAARSGWTGWIVFAGVMMMVVGSFQVIQGLVAMFHDGFYLVRPDGLVVSAGYTTWGLVHLIVGVLACLIGAGLLAGNMVARGAGVALAGFSALANLAFLGAFPLWSVMIIALDVIVIYAIVVHGGELERS
jgi:hypothetical protein